MELRDPLSPLLALDAAARAVPDRCGRCDLVRVDGELEPRDGGRVLLPQLPDHGAASHPSSGRERRPSTTSSCTSSAGTGHENHLRASRSGAATAARTPATTSASSPPSARRNLQLIPAAQLGRVPVPPVPIEHDLARDDGPDPLEPCPHAAQRLGRETQLLLDLVQEARPCAREMGDEPRRVASFSLGVGQSRAAERVGQRRDLAREEDAGPAQQPQPVDSRLLTELETPGPLRLRVGCESLATWLVRLLVTGAVEARQRATRRQRHDAPLAGEGLGLGERLQGQFRPEAQRHLTLLVQLVHQPYVRRLPSTRGARGRDELPMP